MNVRPEQLAEQLQRELKPLYLVSGDQPLLVQEACDAIRAAARTAGYTNRKTFHVDAKFNWDELFYSGSAMSLFAEQNLLEVRLLKVPDKAGREALLRYAQSPAQDSLLLIITPKLDKRTQNTPWFKAVDAAGCQVALRPIEPGQLPDWINQRMKQHGLKPQREAVELLAELVEGNLLAAAQEIEKLSLLSETDEITAQIVTHAVSDSTRYNLFYLIDTALTGDAAHALRILRGLHGEGTDALALIWGLARELRQLLKVRHAVDQGQPLQRAMQAQGVWRNRQQITGKAVSRLSQNAMKRINLAIGRADQTAKGISDGSVWDQLEAITLTLAGSRPVSFR